jgi:hypothetical protein
MAVAKDRRIKRDLSKPFPETITLGPPLAPLDACADGAA